MILQALVRRYEDLVARGEPISPPGWVPIGVSYALRLREDGTLAQVVSLRHPETQGKKTVMVPQQIEVPEPPNRHGKVILPGFLSGNAKYLLGYDPDDPERALAYFASERELHLAILANVDTPAARAVRGFFSTWNPAQAKLSPVLSEVLDDLKKGVNLIFQIGLDQFAHEDPAIRDIWQQHYEQNADAVEGVCLVTGKTAPIAVLHPMIKGIPGGQSNGVSLVSFNARSLESYGQVQGANAPTSKYAAFAYTTALNHLLADRAHRQTIGDTTYVFWAEGGEEGYADMIAACLFGSVREGNELELKQAMEAFSQCRPICLDGIDLDYDQHIYILGLSPNAARASVRFFWKDSFGAFRDNINAHYARMELKPKPMGVFSYTPRAIMSGALAPKGKNPHLYGSLVRAIMNDTPYPPTISRLIHARIRADGEVNRCRAGFFKATLAHTMTKEEVQKMSAFDPTCKDVAYVTGALFAVYERIQEAANPGINATIHDRYFCLAQDAPKAAFHRLNRLVEVQLKQIRRRDNRTAARLSNSVKELMDRLSVKDHGDLLNLIPTRFTLSQKNLFIVGYYHRRHWSASTVNDPDYDNTPPDSSIQNQEGE